jgi:hypothetical protein
MSADEELAILKHQDLYKLLIDAQERVRILRGALKFYANNDNYDDRHGKTMVIDIDNGDEARAALEATK